ncbi:MAG TPA: hypothetical protein VK689_22615 [Armatimonadota bacterium]|nr:hypothetical protein [Armatimonadota bacterium]
MRQTIARGALLGMALAWAVAQAASPAEAAPRIRWARTYAAAAAQAKKTRKLVMVDFSTPW